MKKIVGSLKDKYQNAPVKKRNLIRGSFIALIFGVCGVVVLISSFADSSNISGAVFNDFNGNGRRENWQTINPSVASERGIEGVVVKAFGADGQLCDTKTTNSLGEYTLDMGSCTDSRYRVEFSSLPTDTHPSQLGADNQSTTQFVASGGVANLGVYRPDEFCQNNPSLATSCHSFGSISNQNSGKDAIVGFPFNITGTTTPPMKMGTVGQAGTVWGLTYRRSSNTVFSGAYMKRHADFGPDGLGAIYESAVPTNGSGTTSPVLKATIPNTGTNPHPISDTNCNSVDGQTSVSSNLCWARDEFSFSAVGKRSLGGLSLIPDLNNSSNDSLVTVNLNDRKLYKISNLDTTPSVSSYDLPLGLPNSGVDALPMGSASGQHQICEINDVRPFAVTYYQSVGYVGLVCSAQTSRDLANLRAYIYSFNPSTMQFSTVPTIEFPLNYGRSCSNGNNDTGCPHRANWLPWIDTFNDSLVNDDKPPLPSGLKILTAPQPMLSDIVFGSNGSMTIGIRDRYGDQMGYQAFNTANGDGTLYAATSTGDILRACLVGGKYVLENAGLCDGKGPGSSGVHAVVNGLPQGPGDYEFYNFDYFADDNNNPIYHDEGAQGSLAQVPGFDTVVSSSMNPLNGIIEGAWSGGLRWYNSEDGTKSNAYRLFRSNYPDSVGNPYFGKANGTGDVIAICSSAPIEVGNLVWEDINSNGIQDSNEPVIPGVTVTLVDANGTVLATAITDQNGNYLFSNRAQDENGAVIESSASHKYGISSLTANTQGFRLELRTESDYSSQDRLQGLSLTTPESRINYGSSQNDSSAIPLSSGLQLSATNPAIITFATGATGANDHTLDFGFTTVASVNDPVEEPVENNPPVNPPNPQTNTNNPTTPPATPAPTSNKIATVFANTGQALVASILTAILLISGGVAFFIVSRRNSRSK